MVDRRENYKFDLGVKGLKRGTGKGEVSFPRTHHVDTARLHIIFSS